MDKELKPCPFCGGEAKLRQYREKFLLDNKPRDCYMVLCKEKDCGCGTSYEKTSEKAIAAWNRRQE